MKKLFLLLTITLISSANTIAQQAFDKKLILNTVARKLNLDITNNDC